MDLGGPIVGLTFAAAPIRHKATTTDRAFSVKIPFFRLGITLELPLIDAEI